MEGLKGYFFSLCLLCAFLLVGKLLRSRVKLLQRLFLPSSIIAGFIALGFGPYGLDLIPAWVVKQWSQVPGVLINVVFAALFLGVALPRPRKLWETGGSQLCFGVVMGMGQYLVALLTTVLLLGPLFHTPAIFACIVEIGFSGGHGTAAGMTPVFEKLGFTAGGPLAQMSATVGIIGAVVIGIALINIAIRRGYCACLDEKEGIPAYKKTGLIPEPKRFSIATATVATEAIEPLTFHFAIIAIAVLAGWVMLSGVRGLHPLLSGFPLFPLAMMGGLLVQGLSAPLRVTRYFDRATFDRIQGFSLDVLVLSAIAAIRLDLFVANVWPFLIIMATGIVWATFAMRFLAPRMFPRFWFERGITEFGMQTGVTAIGLLLLRVVDPMYRTEAATAFGFKQMVYEPFLGGGLITAMAPFLIIGLGKWGSIGAVAGVMAIFVVIAVLSKWVTLRPKLKFQDARFRLQAAQSEAAAVARVRPSAA